MTYEIGLWVGFNLFIFLMLALDLGVFQKKKHIIEVKEALVWSIIWILLALAFNVFIYYDMGEQKALEFLTGYLLERSLSIDNIFVFILLFSYFKVPRIYQHKVLFWGVLGALILRGILIAIGSVMVAKFAWVIYIFGGFLVVTGFRMAFHNDEGIDPEKNFVVKTFRKLFPVTPEYHDDKFIVKINGRNFATPLLVVLVAVEFADLIFAFDSIPAIFAVTNDAFIVYTSNIFAILGLRTLYFALDGIMDKFHYLKIGLSMTLIFIGFKMLIIDLYKIPIEFSLSVIALILTASVVLSLVFPLKKKDNQDRI